MLWNAAESWERIGDHMHALQADSRLLPADKMRAALIGLCQWSHPTRWPFWGSSRCTRSSVCWVGEWSQRGVRRPDSARVQRLWTPRSVVRGPQP